MNKFRDFVKVAYRPMPILKSQGGFLVLSNPKRFKETWGIRTSLKNILVINGDWYFKKDEFSKFKEKFGKYIAKDSNNLMRIINECYRDSEKLHKLSKNIKDARSFLSYRNLADKWWLYIIVIYGGEDYYEKHLKEYLREKLGSSKKVDKYFNILVHPSKENIVFEEKYELLKIGSAIQKKLTNYSKLPKEEIDKVFRHFLKYRWLSARGYYGKEWQFEDVLSRLKDFLETDCQKELEKIDKQKQKEKLLYQKALKELSPDKKILGIIKTAKEFLYFRTYRTDVLHQADFISRKFLLNLCAKHDFKYEEIIHLNKDEIYKLANNGFSNAQIQRLKKRPQEILKSYIFLMLDGKMRLITNNKKIELIRQMVELEYSGIKEFRGIVANTGKAQGKVKIVMKNQDIKKIQKNDILVTNMTHPNYIVAMEKAAAFITDEGGITCHAAIVSRELNKPCIIGTKIATKVLKDGDEVEVDANKGVVKIIKKS